VKPTRGLVKGVNFVGARHFVEQYRVPGAWPKVVAAMPAEHRDIANEALPVGWYPTEAFIALLQAIDRELGSGPLTIMPELGRFQAEHDLNVFFRFMLRFWSPAILIEKAAQVWDRYHDSGVWKVTRLGDHRVVGEVTGWLGASDVICSSSTSYIRRLFELVGASKASVEHTQCITRGDDRCAWTIDWK
jgi:hypothetical protein